MTIQTILAQKDAIANSPKSYILSRNSTNTVVQMCVHNSYNKTATLMYALYTEHRLFEDG